MVLIRSFHQTPRPRDGDESDDHSDRYDGLQPADGA